MLVEGESEKIILTELGKARLAGLNAAHRHFEAAFLLRAIAIAALAPALINAGFVPYRLVRRDKKGKIAGPSLIKLRAALDDTELPMKVAKTFAKTRRRTKVKAPGDQEFLARLEASASSQIDRLTLKSTPTNPVSDLIYDDFSPAFFVAGYGATRRVESGDFSSSNEDKRRGRRYQRVASLFEDHVALRPLQSWFPQLKANRKKEVAKLLNSALPPNLRFDGKTHGSDYIFRFDGVHTPFPALSDGYKAFIGWVSDLLGHMSSVSQKKPLAHLTGIVLVDEIDLHLHPSWQRDAVAQLAKAFPRLQFVFTSHSALVAASVRAENVIVTGTDSLGVPTLERMQESLYGRSIEAVLMSPYFGLDSARPMESREATASLAAKVSSKQGGDVNAAEAFLKQLSDPVDSMRRASASKAS